MKTIERLGQIEYMGEAAHRLLSSQLRGKVLAVVSHAAYLLNENGDLFWLAMRNIPMHRRSIRLSEPFPRLSVEAPFSVSDHHLIIGSKTALDFGQACIWEPPRFSPDSALPVADLPRRLGEVASILKDLPAPGGFGSLIPEILMIAFGQNASNPQPIPAGIPGHARPAVREIATACLARDWQRIMEQAYFLAGLGEGLTPSGDDFIGGLLFCAKSLQRSYADIVILEFPSLADFIENLKASTHIISHTLLKDHAEGCAVDTLHQFANAFLTGQPIDHLRQIALGLVQIGHSTGWDILTGFLVGLLLAFPDYLCIQRSYWIPTGHERN